MLDVHPPHQPAHGWRDFLIHIATIVVGLLIALGLEQLVEKLQDRHERHQLVEDLRQEAVGRNRDIEANDRAIVALGEWFRADLKAALAAKAVGTTVTFALPLLPQTSGDSKPEAAVWTAAKASGVVKVLSRSEIESFERVDYFAQLTLRDLERTQATLMSFQATADHLGLEFKPGTRVIVSRTGRDELTRAMASVIESTESLHHDDQEAMSASENVLQDRSTSI